MVSLCHLRDSAAVAGAGHVAAGRARGAAGVPVVAACCGRQTAGISAVAAYRGRENAEFSAAVEDPAGRGGVEAGALEAGAGALGPVLGCAGPVQELALAARAACRRGRRVRAAQEAQARMTKLHAEQEKPSHRR